jgi:uncharacterized protein
MFSGITSIEMSLRTDTFDLAGLRLSSGEGRRVALEVALQPLDLGGEHYVPDPELVPARLDVSRTTGSGYALRLRFTARLTGPCMRCLSQATPEFAIDAREISQPGEIDELDSPYVTGGPSALLDVSGWAHDALALAIGGDPILCRPDCAGLCAVCGVDLNAAGPDHHHDSGPDPRWAKLSELKFD